MLHALNGTTLHDTTQNDLVNGVLRYKATLSAENSFGIETFKYFQDYNKVDDSYPNVRVELDVNSWKNQIVENVQSWLTSSANTASYTSAYAAFANESSIDISGLVQAYNVDYTQLNQG